jgi:hypothetical protein
MPKICRTFSALSNSMTARPLFISATIALLGAAHGSLAPMVQPVCIAHQALKHGHPALWSCTECWGSGCCYSIPHSRLSRAALRASSPIHTRPPPATAASGRITPLSSGRGVFLGQDGLSTAPQRGASVILHLSLWSCTKRRLGGSHACGGRGLSFPTPPALA